MPGGGDKGTGRFQKDQTRPDRAWVRSRRLFSSYTPGEYDDLRQLADAWNVGLSHVVWAFVAERLAHLRNRKLEDLPYTEESREILRDIGYRGLKGQWRWDIDEKPLQGDPDADGHEPD